ncbi:hypothetical protein DIPPA_04126 [Diplonema papillatum]|nr:hypothetical protein DIPPA_04126 [Diplonema papillatum]
MAAEEPSYCDPYSRSDAVAEARVEVETRVLGKKDKGAWEAILARLKSIEKQSFNKEDSMIDTLHKEAAKVSNRVLVAEATTRSRRFAGEGIVGYLIYSNNLKQEGCSRILKVAVAKANRRQGVGRALLTAACRLSKAERSPSMQLHIALARASKSCRCCQTTTPLGGMRT